MIGEVDHDIHCTVNGANGTKEEPLDEDNSPYNKECIIRSHEMLRKVAVRLQTTFPQRYGWGHPRHDFLHWQQPLGMYAW